MNWGTAVAFLLLVACTAHALRMEPIHRPSSTTAASAGAPQPGGGNDSLDASEGKNSPQKPLLAIASSRRACGRGTGRRCPMRLPARPRLVRRLRTTTSTRPTTTSSPVESWEGYGYGKGKWLVAGDDCSARFSCPVGKCCVNTTIGGIAQSMCQDLARQGEYCSLGGQQPPYIRFCPCEGDSQCKPLVRPSPHGRQSSSISICQ